MYKIFEIFYNDGAWHPINRLHDYYIAQTEEEVKEKSSIYKTALRRQSERGGDLYILEYPLDISTFYPTIRIENITDFDLTFNIKEKK